jgi:tRNA threonylcarbamoyladenosine biosynthesis protein TsaB
VHEALLTSEEVAAAALRSVAVIVCEAKVAEALVDLKPVMVREPLAADALPFAVDRVEAQAFDDVAALDANYLRRTDAEIFAKPVEPTK